MISELHEAAVLQVLHKAFLPAVSRKIIDVGSVLISSQSCNLDAEVLQSQFHFSLKDEAICFGNGSSPRCSKLRLLPQYNKTFREIPLNIPQSRPLQKCLEHHAQDACSSSSETGSRYLTFAAQQRPGSSSGWRAAPRCHFQRHGP